MKIRLMKIAAMSMMLTAGLLTPILVLLSAVLVLLCIGLLGFPLIALLWLVIGAACLLGWAAMGQVVGRWMGDRLGLHGMTSVAEAGLGAFTHSLVLGLIQAIPLVGIGGGLLSFGILCVGLGAVVLSRFGRQDHQPGQPFLPQRPVAPRPPGAAAVGKVKAPRPMSVPSSASTQPLLRFTVRRYDPEKHHRRSIRLKGYDYAQAGAYFVTIVCQHRLCLLEPAPVQAQPPPAPA